MSSLSECSTFGLVCRTLEKLSSWDLVSDDDISVKSQVVSRHVSVSDWWSDNYMVEIFGIIDSEQSFKKIVKGF